MNEWKCPVCETINDKQQRRCAACGSIKPPNTVSDQKTPYPDAVQESGNRQEKDTGIQGFSHSNSNVVETDMTPDLKKEHSSPLMIAIIVLVTILIAGAVYYITVVNKDSQSTRIDETAADHPIKQTADSEPAEMTFGIENNEVTQSVSSAAPTEDGMPLIGTLKETLDTGWECLICGEKNSAENDFCGKCASLKGTEPTPVPVAMLEMSQSSDLNTSEISNVFSGTINNEGAQLTDKPTEKTEAAPTQIAENRSHEDNRLLVKLAQLKLNDQGFTCGTPDGKSGSKTKAAVRAYREARGLEQSDRIDTELLFDMGISVSGEVGTGDIVTFGEYGGEVIEWLVLETDGDVCTMITVKGQEALCFNTSLDRPDEYCTKPGNTWEGSYIRKWLNNGFYNSAFTVAQKASIVTGKTGDNVWLLSSDEVDYYFPNGEDKQCVPTEHAKNNYCEVPSSWWTRSAGDKAEGWVFYACAVNGYTNEVNSHGSVYSSGYMARPVITVSMTGIVNNDLTLSEDRYKAGQCITFGLYRGEPIEWLILDVNGLERTMISSKILEERSFNSDLKRGNSWKNSDIRNWLNGDFYSEAFKDAEKNAIVTGPTNDRVWLLSTPEMDYYFPNGPSMFAYPTENMKARGIYVDGKGRCWWMLRTGNEDDVFVVLDAKAVYTSRVNSSNGIRPVITVTIDKL